MTGIYKIADKRIEIISLYEKVHNYCKDYRDEGIPDFTVITTQADIDHERERSVRADISQEPSDDYLEELAVYRKIAERMPMYDTFLLHGSAVAVDGMCYLFTARSGTGKSTHTKLWRRMLGSRAVMVNDDKPLLRVEENGVTVFGTPYKSARRSTRDMPPSLLPKQSAMAWTSWWL